MIQIRVALFQCQHNRLDRAQIRLLQLLNRRIHVVALRSSRDRRRRNADGRCHRRDKVGDDVAFADVGARTGREGVLDIGFTVPLRNDDYLDPGIQGFQPGSQLDSVGCAKS